MIMNNDLNSFLYKIANNLIKLITKNNYITWRR